MNSILTVLAFGMADPYGLFIPLMISYYLLGPFFVAYLFYWLFNVKKVAKSHIFWLIGLYVIGLIQNLIPSFIFTHIFPVSINEYGTINPADLSANYTGFIIASLVVNVLICGLTLWRIKVIHKEKSRYRQTAPNELTLTEPNP